MNVKHSCVATCRLLVKVFVLVMCFSRKLVIWLTVARVHDISRMGDQMIHF